MCGRQLRRMAEATTYCVLLALSVTTVHDITGGSRKRGYVLDRYGPIFLLFTTKEGGAWPVKHILVHARARHVGTEPNHQWSTFVACCMLHAE
jgi:hypothetical protein